MKWYRMRWIVACCYLLAFVPFTGRAASPEGISQKGSVQQESFQSQAQKSAEEATSEPVKATLIAEEKAVQGGRPFWVGVELKMAQGWDTYWVNPGDAGFPTKIDWQLPEGFAASTIHWPYPERFQSQQLVGYGYTNSVLLLTEITPPANLKEGTPLELKANVSWLACKEQCVPGSAKVSLQLPATGATPEKEGATAAQFAKARQLLPQALGDEKSVAAKTENEAIIFNFTQAGEITEALFIPESNGVIDLAAPQELQKGEKGLYFLNLKRLPSEASHLKGVLLVSEKGSELKKAIQIDTALVPASTSASTASITLSVALLFAFVGGLILNVMPCVLPVIAIKIFSFVKMGQERRSVILKHGGAFSFGVILSFWILSGALLILRAYGEGIGWGFQLQEPVFVVVLTLVLFLLSLSLFGLFEMGTSLMALGNQTQNTKSPLLGSFLSGVLATVVATPCTGPLLGPALGFAMTLPAPSALLIFTMMGLGMASPYLLFAAFPKLVKFLPKPGDWMIVFKQLMGFIMLATCLWLLWVFSAQTEMIALFIVLAALLILAAGGWIYGKWATPLQSRGKRMVAMGCALMLLGVGSVAAIKAAQTYKDSSTGTQTELVGDSSSPWQPYSPQRVAELRKGGTPVFVDFTAKWCLICQTNKVPLHADEVQQAFKEKGVVLMEADWTKKDPVITQALHEIGRSGVPVYVLFPGDPGKEPLILPQTLSKGVVLDYLDKIDGVSQTVMHVD